MREWGLGSDRAETSRHRESRFADPSRQEGPRHKTGRAHIWSSALRAVEEHPFTGIGLGVFNQMMPVPHPY